MEINKQQIESIKSILGKDFAEVDIKDFTNSILNILRQNHMKNVLNGTLSFRVAVKLSIISYQESLRKIEKQVWSWKKQEWEKAEDSFLDITYNKLKEAA